MKNMHKNHIPFRGWWWSETVEVLFEIVIAVLLHRERTFKCARVVICFLVLKCIITKTKETRQMFKIAKRKII